VFSLELRATSVAGKDCNVSVAPAASEFQVTV